MQYSIRGILNTDDDTKIKGVINKYKSLDRDSLKPTSDEIGKPQFVFELKTKQLDKKDGLFAEFKELVDEYSGRIDWHECKHDETGDQPCQIIETYEVIS